jgi:prephenate dehydrogenase
MGRKVTVVGCGVIGTSIAMAAARTSDAVSGWDSDAGVLSRSAAASGLAPATGIAEAVGGAGLVFVCTPIGSIPRLVAEVLRSASGAVVADVGSTKSSVVGEVRCLAAAEDLGRFVGSHPMGGSERSGPDAASASLLDGAVWVLTPTQDTEAASAERLETWVSSVGAKPVRMDPVKHDRVVALVSHLPQVVSTSLMGLAAREHEGVPETLLLAAGGFRDLTRLAASNPGLWADILRSNREELTAAIDLFVAELGELRATLVSGSAEDLRQTLEEATRARLALAARPQVKAGVAIVQVPVPDRPGALAELTAALSARGVNIEDLQIVHSPEGGRGTVHLTLAGAEVGPATEAARAGGFEVLRIA